MYWSWWRSGLALAGCFLLAVVLVKPIGVSTQFVILDGIIADAINDNWVVADGEAAAGYASGNAYLNKSGGKYAGAIANPLNYSFVFVLSMALGGAIGGWRQRRATGRALRQLPQAHSRRFGDSATVRYALAFGGGVLVLFGARLAGGCTSGHMMSGIMQSSLSGYLFALGAFAAAVPVARWVYRP